MKITAHSPQYTANGTVSIQVKFPWLSEEVSFHATPDDSEAHGREIYARAISGEFGDIAPYVPPVVIEEPVPAAPVQTPLEKLQAFLQANPDVASML